MMHVCPWCDKMVKRRDMKLVCWRGWDPWYVGPLEMPRIRPVCKECIKKNEKERVE